MEQETGRLNYLFMTTKGRILLNVAIISLVVAVFGTLSGPMKEWGIAEITRTTLGMEMLPHDREGRIIMLYHTIAIAFLSLLVYIITDLVKMAKEKARTISNTITIGYIMVVFFGLGFAYWGRNWAFHGLFLVGQALVFYAGVLLASALWPWNKEFYEPKDSEYAHLKSGFPLERTAFWVMAMATLGSAIFGAVTGSYWGNGHETFLGENGVRHVSHTALQLAIIGHLHIMLTLIGIAASLIVGRWYDWKGILQKIGMWLFIIGTIVITLGVWSVVPYQLTAHAIIYVGAVFSMSGALMLVIYGWRQLMGFGGPIKEKVGFVVRIQRLLSDPLKFGALWQMVFMNFTVSGVGIFMAIKLEPIFRVIPFREERITLTGHWHILSALTGTIILFYLMSEVFPIRGKVRKAFGWTILIGSDLGFAMMTLFSLKRLWVAEENQEGMVRIYMLLTDVGLGVTETILGVYMVIVLVRFFGKKLSGMAMVALLVLLPQTGKAAVSVDTDPSILRAELTVDPESWVNVPAGHFLSGLNDHDVTIPYDFEVMVTEVTNTQYAAFLNDALVRKLVKVKDGLVMGYYHGDTFNQGRHEVRLDPGEYKLYHLDGQRARIVYQDNRFSVVKGYELYPVTYVSWIGAYTYAASHGYRLPLKLEWEKAARGTDGRSFTFVHEPTPQRANYYHSKDPFDDQNGVLPVGFYNGKIHGGFKTIDSPGPYGTYDMGGNVAEWTGDIIPTSHQRLIYGGSQMDYDFDLRVYTENSSVPEYMTFQVGFRCVRDLNGPPPPIEGGSGH